MLDPRTHRGPWKSTTARTERLLELLGVEPHAWSHAERRISRTRTDDLFGIIDTLAILEGGALLGIQTTDFSSAAKHITKITKHPSTPVVLSAGILVEVWAWRLIPVRGSFFDCRRLYLDAEHQVQWSPGGRAPKPGA